MRSLTCGIYDTNEPIYKTERLTDREQTCGCQMGGRMGRDEVRGWKWQNKLSVCRMDKQQGLTV